MLVSPLLLTIVLTLSTGIQSYELEQISEIGDRVNALIKTPIAPKGSEGSFAKADGSFGHSINDPLPRQCRR